MFSCASNKLTSFQAIYLKFVEDVDILVNIYAKFYNEGGRTIGIPGTQKLEMLIFYDFSCFYFIVAKSKLQTSIVRDPGKTVLSGTLAKLYCQGH